ncbi:MAG: glycosyltransferase [Bradymonadia bacterium]
MSRPDPRAESATAPQFFDDISEGDDPVLLGTVTTEGNVVRLRDQLEKARLAPLMPEGRSLRILDLGGGAGRLALWMAPWASEIVVVEASAQLVEKGKQAVAAAGHSEIEFVCCSVMDFEAEGHFDLIVMWGLCTYLTEAEIATLSARCHRWLDPEGTLIIKEPVSTDHLQRYDTRRDDHGEIVYQACFRPGAEYPHCFAEHFSLVHRGPTCAHIVPWFVNGTEGAVEVSQGALGQRILEAAGPWMVRLDPTLRALESVWRQSALSPLLAPIDVIQEVYVFAPRPPVDPEHTPDLSVVVIAYNEAECIEPVVHELCTYLEEARLDFELVLVDDGSSDDTLALMHRLGADPRVRVLTQPNMGIGGALRTGFDAAQGHWVTWVPADGQIAPEAVESLFHARGEHEMVTTVYRHRADAWYRMVISNTLNMMIKAGTGQQARSGGNYLFPRESWLKYGPRDDDSMMISTAFRHNITDDGGHIEVIEIDARARVAGRSKVLDPITIGRTALALLSMSKGQ